MGAQVKYAARAVLDKVNFTSVVASQGAWVQGGTPLVTDFVAFEFQLPPDNAYYPGHFPAVGAITVNVKGVGGHAGVPGGKPTLTAFLIDLPTGTITSLGAGVADGSASAAAYDAEHTITLTPAAPVAVRANQRLVAYCTGEGTSNQIAGLSIKGATATLLI